MEIDAFLIGRILLGMNEKLRLLGTLFCREWQTAEHLGNFLLDRIEKNGFEKINTRVTEMVYDILWVNKT